MFLGPSNTTGKIEIAFVIVAGISVFFLALVTFFMIFFVVKYNKKRHPEATAVGDSTFLEIVWTFIPTVLVLALFYFGWKDFDYIRNAPKDAMTVKVIARQWSWSFEYADGKQSDILRVPLGKPIKLIMTSKDVIHSFFVPAFRIKEDCVPGMQTHLWFRVDDPGSYDVFCTEYCGVGHSHMRTKIVAVPQAEFAAWYGEATPERMALDTGFKLLSNKGCIGCHSVDGSAKVGPTLKGVYDHRVTVLVKGKERTMVADEAYLKTMILHPGVCVVKGYPNIMPTIPLTPTELKTIVEYLKKLE